MSAMNGVIFDSSTGSVVSESTDACESFLENYSRGNIDVGTIDPPEAAFAEFSQEALTSGHFEPPLPPDEAQRVRELYNPSYTLSNCADTNFVFWENSTMTLNSVSIDLLDLQL
jgi:hypothetical protein